MESGHYHLVADNTVQDEVGLVIPAGQFTYRIVFDNQPNAHKTFFQISANKLNLLSGYFPLDGGSNEVYERIMLTFPMGPR